MEESAQSKVNTRRSPPPPSLHTRVAVDAGLLASVAGRTPDASMAAALYTDVKRKGGASPFFVRRGEGLFGLAARRGDDADGNDASLPTPSDDGGGGGDGAATGGRVTRRRSSGGSAAPRVRVRLPPARTVTPIDDSPALCSGSTTPEAALEGGEGRGGGWREVGRVESWEAGTQPPKYEHAEARSSLCF